MMTASGIYPFEDQPEKVFLQLTAKPAVKQGDKWFCTVVVHAHLRGHVNFPDCPLVLLVDGKDVGRETDLGEIMTNNQGLFSHSILLPGPGRWLMGVKIKDTSIMAQEWVETPEEKKRSPEEEELALHRLRLEKTKVEQELAKLQAKPSSQEEELAAARLKLELARVDAELKKLDAAPSETERNVAEARTKLELVRIMAELEKLGAQPSSQERELAESKLKLEQAKVEKELADLQRAPDSARQELEEKRLTLERAKIEAELMRLRAEPNPLERQLAEAKLRRELTQIEQELVQLSQLRRAADWEIKVSGEDGKQTIRVTVFNAANQPVSDWPVEITGADIDPPIRRTDADGIVSFGVNFREKSREVRLFLRGTPKDHRLSLDGPIRDISNKPFYVWGIVNVILLVVGLTVVGFNPSAWEVRLTAPPSEIAQRYRNEYRFGQFKTDAELDREGIKVQRPQPKTISSFVRWYWRGFWASILGMIVCFFAVFRDDARRSWRRAKQGVTRRYGVGEVDIREGRASLGETLAAIKQGQQTSGQPSAAPAGEQALTSRQFWRVYPLMELGISFLSDMVSNAVFHRKSA